MIIGLEFRCDAIAIDFNTPHRWIAPDDRNPSVLILDKPNLDNPVAADLTVDRIDRAVHEQLPPLDNPDRGATVGQFRQNVAGDQNRFAHLAQLFEQRFDLDPSSRIQSARRFVKDQHRRVMHKRLGQTQPLLHPPGKSVDKVVAFVGQVEQLEHIANDFFALRATDLISHRKEVEKLPYLHPIVHAEVVGHVANAPTHIHRLLVDAKTVDGSIPTGALKKRCKEPDRGALASSIRTDEAKQLPSLNLHIDRTDRSELAVVFSKVR